MNTKIKILYLEHVARDLKVIEGVFTGSGLYCDIIAVNNKQDFIEALSDFLPDIILADDALPGLTISNVLAIIQQKGFQTPLIALSGHCVQSNVLSIVNMMKLGAYDCIFKENINTLPNAVASALEKYKKEEKLALSEMHEQALRISEANLSAIIENTTDLVYSLDTNLRFITFNQVFKNTIKSVYGFDVEQGAEIVDQLFGYSTEMAEKWTGIFARALNGETQQFVNEYAFGEGKVYLSYSINPIREGGKVIGLSCFSRDITGQRILEIEREKITADLLQRNKALEQFTYIISHNLRAPVANIIGLSALSSTLRTENIEIDEIINNISQSANKLDEVISDLNQVLQVNKPIAEHVGPVLLPVLIEDIKFSIKNLIEECQVNISCNFSEGSEIVSLKSFLYSIFYNLIQNSIKYHQPGVNPLINISTKITGDKINILYNDNGRGIDTSKYRNEIFGLYKRFDTTVEGKGMGLFMVKMQVESLGGNISINSTLNKGTEFIIEFPLQHLQKANTEHPQGGSYKKPFSHN